MSNFIVFVNSIVLAIGWIAVVILPIAAILFSVRSIRRRKVLPSDSVHVTIHGIERGGLRDLRSAGSEFPRGRTGIVPGTLKVEGEAVDPAEVQDSMGTVYQTRVPSADYDEGPSPLIASPQWGRAQALPSISPPMESSSPPPKLDPRSTSQANDALEKGLPGLGRIFFNPPSAMRQLDTCIITATIVRAEPTPQFRIIAIEPLLGSGTLNERSIPTTCSMTASLMSKTGAFDVRPITVDMLQQLDKGRGFGEWQWQVTATRRGPQELILRVVGSAQDEHGNLAALQYDPIDITIKISVNPTVAALGWLRFISPLLLGALIAQLTTVYWSPATKWLDETIHGTPAISSFPAQPPTAAIPPAQGNKPAGPPASP